MAPRLVDVDLRPHQPSDLVGRAQDLPRHPAELTSEDLGQNVELLVSDRRRHDEDRFTAPSWIALGQSRIAATVSPERSTSPQWPVWMAHPTKALQLPSEDVGNPEKLQVQPGLQLQNS